MATETTTVAHGYRPENSRKDRTHNIAVALTRLKKADSALTGMGTARLRAHIRSEMGMPELAGEAHFGDLRAHGDALGGHGLHLDVTMWEGGRAVKLTDDNMRKCADHLAEPQQKFLM